MRRLLIIVCFGIAGVAAAGGRSTLVSLADIGTHVGEYPCSTGLLESPVLLAALKAAIGDDYEAYRKHMGFSGCGMIEKRDSLFKLDVSQLHVGGYGSIIFINSETKAVHVYWLRARVWDKNYRIYGPRPVPGAVMEWIVESMNVEWGHVATFSAKGEELAIALKSR